VTLRRSGARWNGEALVQLPQSLGESAHLTLQMTGDPEQPDTLNGVLDAAGRRLEPAGWRLVQGLPRLAALLPQSGVADLEVRMQFARGVFSAGRGKLRAEDLAWAPRAAGGAAWVLPRLAGEWRLAQERGQWQLQVTELIMSERAPAAALAVALSPDLEDMSGSAQRVPLAALSAFATWCAADLPLRDLTVTGSARRIDFDWSAHRAPGERLKSSAFLEAVSLAVPQRALAVAGLAGRVALSDAGLEADVDSPAAEVSVGDRGSPLTGITVAAHLVGSFGASGWQLRAERLQLQRAAAVLSAAGSMGAAGGGGAAGQLEVHGHLGNADVAELAALAGGALAFPGAEGAQLTAGRITAADFALRGALHAEQPWSEGREFRGALELHDATLAGGERWPQVQGLDARVVWRGPRVHAALEAGHAGSWQLRATRLDWDLSGKGATHLVGRFDGHAEEALLWLRERPALLAYAGAAGSVPVSGPALLDVDLLLPASGAPGTGHSRISALLDGVEVQPLAGLPPIQALRGTLALNDAHLHRSTFTGQWLGGPVALTVAPHPEGAAAGALTIGARGLLSAREALLALNPRADPAPLSGATEWNALLAVAAADAHEGRRWRVRADSSLAGVTSTLPEPLAKTQASTLALHLEAQGDGARGGVRISLGERLRGIVALGRSGDAWRIERGAVRLAPGAPTLPGPPVLTVAGTVGRLDLPAYLALWRQAGSDPVLPAVQARVSAGQLDIGPRSYANASITALASRDSGQVAVDSAELAGVARWGDPDAQRGTLVHLTRLSVERLGDAALGTDTVAALGAEVLLTVDALRWHGRVLGRLTAQLGAQGGGLQVEALDLSSPSERTRGRAHCQKGVCELQFALESQDAAATLQSFGLRPEIEARHAQLSGELRWPQQDEPSLASLSGRLHMQVEDGATAVAVGPAAAPPLALLAVPALVRVLAAPAPLRFASLSADYALRDGQAETANLDFDGDAQIMMRGRVGIAARDYDTQAWILKGEERLPAAVRHLAPAGGMAALWLSLRELLAGNGEDRGGAGLRLQGTWDDPVVTPAE
jgi:uncharacterized protein YhdP